MEQTFTLAPLILNMDILNYLLSEYGASSHPGSLDTKYLNILGYETNLYKKVTGKKVSGKRLEMKTLVKKSYFS